MVMSCMGRILQSSPILPPLNKDELDWQDQKQKEASSSTHSSAPHSARRTRTWDSGMFSKAFGRLSPEKQRQQSPTKREIVVWKPAPSPKTNNQPASMVQKTSTTAKMTTTNCPKGVGVIGSHSSGDQTPNHQRSSNSSQQHKQNYPSSKNDSLAKNTLPAANLQPSSAAVKASPTNSISPELIKVFDNSRQVEFVRVDNLRASSSPEKLPQNRKQKLLTPDIERLSSPMTSSILANPAWYRDQQGRTGFRSNEWTTLPNLQRSPVKTTPSPTEDKTPSNQQSRSPLLLIYPRISSTAGISSIPSPTSHSPTIRSPTTNGIPLQRLAVNNTTTAKILNSKTGPIIKSPLKRPAAVQVQTETNADVFKNGIDCKTNGNVRKFRPFTLDVKEPVANRNSPPQKNVTFSDQIEINEIEQIDVETPTGTECSGQISPRELEDDDDLNANEGIYEHLNGFLTQEPSNSKSSPVNGMRNTRNFEEKNDYLSKYRGKKIIVPVQERTRFNYNLMPSKDLSPNEDRNGHWNWKPKTNIAEIPKNENQLHLSPLANTIMNKIINGKIDRNKIDPGSRSANQMTEQQLERVIQEFFRTCDSLTRISNNTNHLTTSPINSSPIASRNSNGWPASSGKLRPLGQSAVFETRLPKLKPASTTVNNGNALLHNGPKIAEQQHSFYDNVTDQSEESRGGLALFNGGKQSSSCAETSGARDARQDDWLKTKFIARYKQLQAPRNTLIGGVLRSTSVPVNNENSLRVNPNNSDKSHQKTSNGIIPSSTSITLKKNERTSSLERSSSKSKIPVPQQVETKVRTKIRKFFK